MNFAIEWNGAENGNKVKQAPKRKKKSDRNLQLKSIKVLCIVYVNVIKCWRGTFKMMMLYLVWWRWFHCLYISLDFTLPVTIPSSVILKNVFKYFFFYCILTVFLMRSASSSHNGVAFNFPHFLFDISHRNSFYSVFFLNEPKEK